MRVLIDICHPAHVHFFRWIAAILEQRGHEVLVTSRDKEVTLRLLNEHGWKHQQLSSASKSGTRGLLWELFVRNFALWRKVKEFRPDVMAAIGGIFIAQVGYLSRTPSVVFYDTENAKLQNLLTYPFASLVVVPNCYESWVPRGHVRYQGYHELSYLHPDRFTPDREVALSNGLAISGETFVLRVVSWMANHDVGERGWSPDLLRQVVRYLENKGKVILSSEAELPEDLKSQSYRGNPAELHHVMAFSRLFVGESATMASESVVLGIPAIYVAQTGRGYCNEQEMRYGLLRNITELSYNAITEAVEIMLTVPMDEMRDRHRTMLDESEDVAEYAASLIINQVISESTVESDDY